MASGQRKIIFTNDGSHSVLVEETGVTYHSQHGAVQESRHVFIDAGLRVAKKKFSGEVLGILEIGFGTGLNAFLTAIETEGTGQAIRYSAIDISPLELGTAVMLNYPEQLGHEELFNSIQLAPWGSFSPVHTTFTLQKSIEDVLQYSCKEKFHLIYFDPFAPETQPEVWTESVFQMLADCTHLGGLLLTYCSKSVVRKAMGAAGWKVEKLPGPVGKREIVRATRLLL